MKTNALVVFAAASVMAALVACSKEDLSQSSPIGSGELIAKDEDPPEYRFPIRVRFRFRYEQQYPEPACGGADCGGCPGLCVLFGGKMVLNPDEPTTEELAEGYGRAELILKGSNLILVPEHLPMDNGDGRTILYENLEGDEDLAREMGYSAVALRAGTYRVDYSNQSDP